MDLLQKDVPILTKIYEAKCFYDSQNNRIILYYKNHVTAQTLVDFYNLSTTPPPNSSLYVIYDLQTGIFNVSTDPPTYTVSNSKVYVTSPINAEYDIDKVIIYGISWYEIDTAIDLNLSTFVRKQQADTITATHTFDPTEPGPAFQLGPNAQNQLIQYLNADKVDGFDASQTPAPNTIPVADDSGKISIDWIPLEIGSNLNADKVDGFHASQTPIANTIPVADNSGTLLPAWIPRMFNSVVNISPSVNTIYQETAPCLIMVVSQYLYGLELSPDGTSWYGKFGHRHYNNNGYYYDGGVITFYVPKNWYWRFSDIVGSGNSGFSSQYWLKFVFNY
jgi:hypothetical protein